MPDCYINLYVFPAWLSRPPFKSPPEGPTVRAPLKFLEGPLAAKHALWDCTIRIPQLEFGASYKMLATDFVSPDFVVPRISAGTPFLIWRGGFIGQGSVAQVVAWAKYQLRE